MECWSVGKSDTRPSSAGNENWIQRDSLMYGRQERLTITPLLQYSNTPIKLGFLMAELNFPDPRNLGGFYVQLECAPQRKPLPALPFSLSPHGFNLPNNR